ncbi:MAG: cbb3-type cytochrome oxidase assembly protein CcoS [Myxococcota bacterium]
MDILYLLIPLALLIVAIAMMAFRWATQDGQFDDLETPALRILMDENKHADSNASSEEDTPRGQHTE